MSERTIFLTALDTGDPAARAAYLDRACAGDTALRQRIEALLQSHSEAGSFLEQPVAGPAGTQASPPSDAGRPAPEERSDHPGTAIGPYELLELIGEGGMGAVWMAQQTEPVRRLVALKLIKPGMD